MVTTTPKYNFTILYGITQINKYLKLYDKIALSSIQPITLLVRLGPRLSSIHASHQNSQQNIILQKITTMRNILVSNDYILLENILSGCLANKGFMVLYLFYVMRYLFDAILYLFFR